MRNGTTSDRAPSRLHEKNRKGMATPVFGFRVVEPVHLDSVEKFRHHGGITMTEELTRLHRSTALHIQRQLSARPKAGNFVAHPLDFLRERPFLPYVDRNIEERIEEEIMKQASSSRGELSTFPEPLAILSESGSGKSILVARLAQRLMKTTNANPERGTLLLFAQLKNAQGSSLLEEICSSVGLGRFSTVHELRSFLPEELRSHRLILLIDSLDESQHRGTWPDVDYSLRTPPENTESDGFNDVLPIWVSRRHDWRAFSPKRHQGLQGLLKGKAFDSTSMMMRQFLRCSTTSLKNAIRRQANNLARIQLNQFRPALNTSNGRHALPDPSPAPDHSFRTRGRQGVLPTRDEYGTGSP